MDFVPEHQAKVPGLPINTDQSLQDSLLVNSLRDLHTPPNQSADLGKSETNWMGQNKISEGEEKYNNFIE